MNAHDVAGRVLPAGKSIAVAERGAAPGAVPNFASVHPRFTARTGFP